MQKNNRYDKKITTFCGVLSFLGVNFVYSQKVDEIKASSKVAGKVGINTEVPTRTFTVKNATTGDKTPPMRIIDVPDYKVNVSSAMDADLGGNTSSSTSLSDYSPLLVDRVGDVYKGDVLTTNILRIKVSNVSGDWIQSFDTGIDYDKYYVEILDDKFYIEDGQAMVSAFPDENSGGKIYSRVSTAKVGLLNSGGHWGIFADYPSVNSQKINLNDSSAGTPFNGTWYFALLVVPKSQLNAESLEFDLNGNASGAGTSDSTYKNKITAFLNKIK